MPVFGDALVAAAVKVVVAFFVIYLSISLFLLSTAPISYPILGYSKIEFIMLAESYGNLVTGISSLFGKA